MTRFQSWSGRPASLARLRRRLRQHARAGGSRVRRLLVEGLEPRVLLSCVPETEDNNSLALASVLTLGNDPSGSGLWGACGTGEVSPAVSGDIWSDPDYWRFDALAGDRVAVRIDTPASDLDPYVELRNAADGVLASDNNGGPVNDALVSRYQIQTSGSYFVRVGKSSSSSVAGAYELHLQIGRGIELESDAGYANDSIGSADPLTLAGEGGGTSLFFDGQNDLVVVGDTPSLRLSGPLTFEAWVYPTDAGADSEPVLVKEGPGGRLSYWFGIGYGRIVVQLNDGGASWALSQGAGSISNGRWQHVAATWDGTTWNMYQDGVLVGSGAWAGPLVSSSSPVTIGSNSEFDTRKFGGIIDEVRVWNVARSQTEIQAAMSHELTGSETGLVSYWNMNEGAGQTVADATGAGNYGLRGSVGPDPAAEPSWLTYGKSLFFDGQDDRVFVGDTPSLRLSGPLTFEAWVYPTDVGSDEPVLVKEGSGGKLSYWFGVQWGHISMGLNDGGSSWALGCSAGSISNGRWQHIAGTWDGTTWKIYQNGELAGSGAWAGPLVSSSSPVTIGSNSEFNSTKFGGIIDEVRVWNVARSQAEIQAAINGALTGNEPGLVSYWRMNEGAGQTVADAAGAGNDGRRGTTDAVDAADPGWLMASGLGEFSPAWVMWGAPLAGDARYRQAGVGGTVMAPEGSNADEDLYALGKLNPQDVAELNVQLPAGSTMSPLVRLLRSDGSSVPDEDGTAGDGHFRATLTITDDYYAEVQSSWDYNGHRYFITPEPVTWTAAESYAQSLGGHLVTLNDAAEQAWVYATFNQFGDSWIGFNDEAVEGTWVWSSGEAVTYTNWSSGEPNNGGGEDYGHLWAATGKWNDAPATTRLRGVVELPLAASGASGPGEHAEYLLQATVVDTVPPQMQSVSRLPAEGGTTGELIGTFTVTMSEALAVPAVNHTQPVLHERAGHLYFLTPTAMTWLDANAYAQSLGGYLVTINDGEEDDWLTAQFAGTYALGREGDVWGALAQIGYYYDPASGQWRWSNGEPVSWTNYTSIFPEGGTHAYLHLANHPEPGTWNALWVYTEPGGTSLAKAIIELPPGYADSDGDGVPDALDVSPADALNTWDLREAGPDGTFDTTDDVPYQLAIKPSYGEDPTVSFEIVDGPLGAGHYRFRASAAVTDFVGNALDGDGDGTGGDAFTRTFDVSLPPGYVFEGRNNDWLSQATALPLVENPASSGYFLGFGIGSQDPAWAGDAWADADYWRIEASAGDRVAVAVDTPDSGADPYVELRNANDQALESSNNEGPDADAYISHYLVPSAGTYYIRVGKQDSTSTPGNYRLRVELARTVQLESDAGYANDSIGSADPLTLAGEGGGTSLFFDGQNDRVVVGDTPSLRLSGPLTFEAWIYPTDAGADSQPVLVKEGPGGRLSYWFGVGYGRIVVQLNDGGASWALSQGAGSISNGRWQHVAATWDGTTWNMYQDGVLVGSGAWAGPLVSSSSPVTIGSNSEFDSRKFGGIIDELRVWNVARSQAEIQAAMSHELTGSEAGLVSYWNMNEGAGQTVADATAAGNHGLRGSVGPDAAAEPSWLTYGKSLFFDGQDDLVVVGDTPSLRLNGPLTFEAWVYPTDAGSDEPVLAKEGPGGKQSYWFGVYQGRFGLLLNDGRNGWALEARDSGAIANRQWQHIASTWDGTAWKNYLNGAEVGSGTWAGPLVTSTSFVTIGSNSEFNTTKFGGIIDELRVWNVARSQAEIQEAMSHELTGSEAGLVSYWSMNEGAGQTVADAAGAANDGRRGTTDAVDAADPGCLMASGLGHFSPGWVMYGAPLAGNADYRQASVGGTVMAGESGNVDEDFFNLGQVQAGQSVLLNLRLPHGSTLDPVIEVRKAPGTLADVISVAPNPVAATAHADITTTGTYYAVVRAWEGEGPRAEYLLDVAIKDTAELDFADLSVHHIDLLVPAAPGQTMAVDWTVGNYGAAATGAGSWYDRVVLSQDDILGNGDDYPLGLVAHSGELGVGQTYDGHADVTLPQWPPGHYWILIESDAGNAVPEFIFESNNVGQQALGLEGFMVVEFLPAATGFTARFSRNPEPSVLNLYDSASQTLGLADVIVRGAAVGPVPGSLVLGADPRQIRFVPTGGLLEPDTYTVTLFSGVTRFHDTTGQSLDGNADGMAGDDYACTFVVASSEDRVVSIPDFARGAAQPVNIPNTAAGLPIRLDNAAGVTSLAVEVLYDTALLNVAAAGLAEGIPSGWTVTLDWPAAGTGFAGDCPAAVPRGGVRW